MTRRTTDPEVLERIRCRLYAPFWHLAVAELTPDSRPVVAPETLPEPTVETPAHQD